MTDNLTASPTALRSFRTLVILYLVFGLTMLMVRDPASLTQYGDLINFFHTAEIVSITGRLPLIGYWVEYPPLFVLVTVGLHQLLIAGAGAPEHLYYYAIALINLTANAVNLWLIYRIGARLYGESRGLDIAWVYALVSAPLVFLMWNLEAVTTLLVLLGLWWLIEGKIGRSALAAAAGALFKILPGLIVPVVWRYYSRKRAITYTGMVLGLGLLAYLPFLLISPTFTIASLRSQLGQSSSQTIWALIDGNYNTGGFGDLSRRLDPAEAGIMLGNSSVIPPWLTLIAFGLLYLYVFTRPIRRTDRAMLAFFGTTWCVFMLWTKGWSPQWMMMILPIILLTFPNRDGVLAILAFSLINFLEWPVLLSRGLTGGLWLTIPLRTAFVIGLLVAFARVHIAPSEESRALNKMAEPADP